MNQATYSLGNVTTEKSENTFLSRYPLFRLSSDPAEKPVSRSTNKRLFIVMIVDEMLTNTSLTGEFIQSSLLVFGSGLAWLAVPALSDNTSQPSFAR